MRAQRHTHSHTIKRRIHRFSNVQRFILYFFLNRCAKISNWQQLSIDLSVSDDGGGGGNNVNVVHIRWLCCLLHCIMKRKTTNHKNQTKLVLNCAKKIEIVEKYQLFFFASFTAKCNPCNE